MKHTLEELLFAAAVRRRVGEMRNARIMNMTDEEAIAYRKEPADGLIAEAVAELEAFAKVIGTLRDKSQE